MTGKWIVVAFDSGSDTYPICGIEFACGPFKTKSEARTKARELSELYPVLNFDWIRVQSKWY